MSDTVLRQWVMLTRIPRAPRKIDSASLRGILISQGFQVDQRTIQRDLQKLATLFPLTCDEVHKPYGWSWKRDATALSAPGIDVHTALAFRLAEDYLQQLLPDSTRDHLRPWFDLARQVLDKLDGNLLSTWPDKVRVLPPGQPMQPPKIDTEILESVQTALLRDRQLTVQYRRRGEQELRNYVVHPLGLVWRDAVAYLVCTLRDYTDVVQLAVHRIQVAEVLGESRRPSPEFSLDAYIASRAFDFRLEQAPIALQIRVNAYVLPRVQETPLASDQEISDQAGDLWLLRATVHDTVQLRAWIRSFGPAVEVLAPANLRAELAAEAVATAALYRTA